MESTLKPKARIHWYRVYMTCFLFSWYRQLNSLGVLIETGTRLGKGMGNKPPSCSDAFSKWTSIGKVLPKNQPSKSPSEAPHSEMRGLVRSVSHLRDDLGTLETHSTPKCGAFGIQSACSVSANLVGSTSPENPGPSLARQLKETKE